MKRIIGIAASMVLGSTLAACGSASDPPTSPSSALQIERNTPTEFLAEYTAAGETITAHVAYTADATSFEIVNPAGIHLVYAGTGKTAPAGTRIDSRMDGDGVVVLPTDDPEYAVMTRFLEDVEQAGNFAETPSNEAASTPMYAAAYFAARMLKQVPFNALPGQGTPDPGFEIRNIEGVARVSRWPFPALYSRGVATPAEGQQNGRGQVNCCGHYDCVAGDYNFASPPGATYAGNCDAWCAAGDRCNYVGLGDCGSKFAGLPGFGCTACPHADSPTIMKSARGACSPTQFIAATGGTGQGGSGCIWYPGGSSCDSCDQDGGWQCNFIIPAWGTWRCGSDIGSAGTNVSCTSPHP